MSRAEAKAEVFYTAFKSLTHTERNMFLLKLLKDKPLREDLIDLSIAEARSKEKSISFEQFLKEVEKKS